MDYSSSISGITGIIVFAMIANWFVGWCVFEFLFWALS